MAIDPLYTPPSPPSIQENIPDPLETLLDKIAEALITSPFVDVAKVRENQKTIRNGIISLGRSNSDKLILFQKDTKANEEDLKLSTLNGGELYTLEGLASTIVDTNSIEIIINGIPEIGHITSVLLIHSGLGVGDGIEIISLLTEVSTQDGLINPLNISQFFNIEQKQTIVDPDGANEFLDTNIYELLPDGTRRQDDINKLFIDLQNLLPDTLPNFDVLPSNAPNQSGDGYVDRDEFGNWVGSQQYYLDNSIASTQDDSENATIDQDLSYITRLSDNGGSQNSGKTIEDIYNLSKGYLTDILEPPALPQDERPEYENQSSGYLKFRNLNQGIIIRNTNDDFIEGLNPETQDYLDTGFTISMWVRFLDKSSEGTLFNFGNPTRVDNPMGFKLETLMDNEKRYVRLLVWDTNIIDADDNVGRYYDSHVGIENLPKVNTTNRDSLSTINPSQWTEIPTNFTEWYFINATFNPVDIDEISSFESFTDEVDYSEITDFWMNHLNPNYGDIPYVVNSGYGNRCKVEIISRTDLLRARGYKV